jgi:hypothetical protein
MASGSLALMPAIHPAPRSGANHLHAPRWPPLAGFCLAQVAHTAASGLVRKSGQRILKTFLMFEEHPAPKQSNN